MCVYVYASTSMHVSLSVHARAMVHVCRSEDNLWESVLSYHVGPAGQTLVLKLGFGGSAFTH